MDLKQAFAYYTECQLATLEDLKARKRFPKCEIERHQSIADGMVRVCQEHAIIPAGQGHPRLNKLLGL